MTGRTLISGATRRTERNSLSTAGQLTFLLWAMMNVIEWLLRAAPQTPQTHKLSRSCHPSITRKPQAQTARKAKRSHITTHPTVSREEPRILVQDPHRLLAPQFARHSRSSRPRHSVPCVGPGPGRRRGQRGLPRQPWRPLKPGALGSGLRRATSDRDWKMTTTTTNTGHDIPLWCPSYALHRSDIPIRNACRTSLPHQCTMNSRSLGPLVFLFFLFFFFRLSVSLIFLSIISGFSRFLSCFTVPY